MVTALLADPGRGGEGERRSPENADAGAHSGPSLVRLGCLSAGQGHLRLGVLCPGAAFPSVPVKLYLYPGVWKAKAMDGLEREESERLAEYGLAWMPMSWPLHDWEGC